MGKFRVNSGCLSLASSAREMRQFRAWRAGRGRTGRRSIRVPLLYGDRRSAWKRWPGSVILQASARRTSRADVTGPAAIGADLQSARDVPGITPMRAQADESGAKQHLSLASFEREMASLRARQAATSRILQAIATAPAEAGRALGMIAESACALCSAYDAVIRLKRGHLLVFGAHHGPIPMDFAALPITPDLPTGRSVLEKRPVHVHDCRSLPTSSRMGQSWPGASATGRCSSLRCCLGARRSG